jgi:hypothetical protein
MVTDFAEPSEKWVDLPFVPPRSRYCEDCQRPAGYADMPRNAGSIFFWSRCRQQATDRLSLHNTKQLNIFPSFQKVLAQPGTLGLLYIVCLENCEAKMYYGQHINLTCGNDRFS